MPVLHFLYRPNHDKQPRMPELMIFTTILMNTQQSMTSKSAIRRLSLFSVIMGLLSIAMPSMSAPATITYDNNGAGKTTIHLERHQGGADAFFDINANAFWNGNSGGINWTKHWSSSKSGNSYVWPVTYNSVNQILVDVSAYPSYGNLYYSVSTNSISPRVFNGTTNLDVRPTGSGVLRGVGTFQINVSPGVSATDYVGLEGLSVSYYSNIQISLLGPIGSQQSPFMQRPQGLPNNEPEPADQSENVSGYGFNFNTGPTGLGRDELIWTSSNLGDLLADNNSAARSLALSPTDLELVYDITGPLLTALLFDSAIDEIVPDIVLDINGLEIPVILGQEIDLTQYFPAGIDHFKLHVSGIDDWSSVPEDWFLTGYRFAGAGDVEVITRAVPEVPTWAMLSIGLGLLGAIRVRSTKRSWK